MVATEARARELGGRTFGEAVESVLPSLRRVYDKKEKLKKEKDGTR